MNLEKALEQIRERGRLRCPYCKEINYEPGNPHDIDLQDLVTYWGEDNTDEEFICVHCDKTFLYTEVVCREWITEPMPGDNPPRGGEKK